MGSLQGVMQSAASLHIGCNRKGCRVAAKLAQCSIWLLSFLCAQNQQLSCPQCSCPQCCSDSNLQMLSCRFLVDGARALGLEVIDRCNLTVLLEPGQEDLVDFLASRQVSMQSVP